MKIKEYLQQLQEQDTPSIRINNVKIIQLIIQKAKKDGHDLTKNPLAMKRIRLSVRACTKEFMKKAHKPNPRYIVKLPFIMATPKGPYHLYFSITKKELLKIM